jgi:hypothetical protein
VADLQKITDRRVTMAKAGRPFSKAVEIEK